MATGAGWSRIRRAMFGKSQPTKDRSHDGAPNPAESGQSR